MLSQKKTKTTLPSIPKVRVSDKGLQQFCDAVTNYLAIHAGYAGNGDDRAITQREMIAEGFANKKSGKVFSNIQNALLVWDDPDFRGSGGTEIWRASVNDFSKATRIATTPATVYSDMTQDTKDYYYWIRFFNTKIPPDIGPLNDAGGTKGKNGIIDKDGDGNYMFVNELVAFAIYATNLTAVHIKGGDMDFAGGKFTVDNNGRMVASAATINGDSVFQGRLDVTAKGSTGRLVISGDRIEVYEGSTLRVRLGRL